MSRKRPAFTVEMNGGINYDANHLTICWDNGWVVAFISSGTMERVPVEMIKEIRFSKNGADYCNECDGPIPNRG